jgi:hypothetical protein
VEGEFSEVELPLLRVLGSSLLVGKKFRKIFKKAAHPSQIHREFIALCFSGGTRAHSCAAMGRSGRLKGESRECISQRRTSRAFGAISIGSFGAICSFWRSYRWASHL